MNALQLSLPLIPEDAVLLSDKLAFSNNNGFIQFFNATGIIYRCLENDKESLMFALGMFFDLKLAKAKDLSNNFGVSESTIYRYKGRFNKVFHTTVQDLSKPRFTKLNDEKMKDAQKLLDNGLSIRFAAKQLNISEGTIRYAIKMKRINHSEPDHNSTKHLKSPSQRSRRRIYKVIMV